MLRFAGEAARLLRRRRDRRAPPRDEARRPLGDRARDRRADRARGTDPLGPAARARRPPGGDLRRVGRDAHDPPRHELTRGLRPRGRARARPGSASCPPASRSGSTRCSDRPRRAPPPVGEVSLSLLRPREPEALLDEEAFANDEFIPYWAELWPAALALAGALPERLAGRRLIELGCGLGVPALVAAARGGEVTALDWAAEAVALLRENAARNGLALEVVHADWRAFAGSYDLALGGRPPLRAPQRRGIARAPAAARAGGPARRAGAAARSRVPARRAGDVGARRARRPRLPAQPACRPRLTRRPGRDYDGGHARWRPHRDRHAVRRRGPRRLRRLPGPRPPPGRARLRRARRRGHDRRERHAPRRRAPRARRGGDRGRRRPRHDRRRDRHRLDGALARADRGSPRPRRRRVPDRDAVLQQAAAARHRRALRGGRRRDRPAGHRLQHPEPCRRQHRARDDLPAGRDPNVRAVKQAHPDLDAGPPRDRLRSRPLRRRRHARPAASSSSAPSAASASTPTSSARRSRSRCAPRREGDLGRARTIDAELQPAYELLALATNPIPVKAALDLLGHEVGGFRLPLVPESESELAGVRDCLARLGLLVAA